MSGVQCCIETIRNGEDYYLFSAGSIHLGAIAVMPAAEYKERISLVAETGDSMYMFNDLAHPEALTQDELMRTTELDEADMSAHAYYVKRGDLGELPDRGSFLAYGNRRPTKISVAQKRHYQTL